MFRLAKAISFQLNFSIMHVALTYDIDNKKVTAMMVDNLNKFLVEFLLLLLDL